MNRITVYLVILIAIFVLLQGNVFAGSNSYSIMVSCTIPAIPGVNVPLVEEESANTQQQQAQEEEVQVEKEQILPSSQEGSFVITKSIYSR